MFLRCSSSKGALTLLLLLVSDILAHVQAVSFWSRFNGGTGRRFEQQQKQQHKRNSSSEGSVSSVTGGNACEQLAGVTSESLSTAVEFMSDGEQRNNRLSFSRTRKFKKRDAQVILSELAELSQECSRQCNYGNGSSKQVSASCANTCTAAAICTSVPRGGEIAEQVIQTNLTPWNFPLKGWKIIFQIFLTALNVLCWLVPLRAKKFSENKLALSLANAFSGGVFLSLAFGHLIPECIHGFKGYNEALPYMTVLGGYLLIFFVEKVAFDAHGILHEMEEHDLPNADPPKGGQIAVKQPTMEDHLNAPSGRSALILLGALAVHSILEMTALGLANTFGDCALLTFSIGIHQPAESLALLVAFLKSGMRKKDIIFFLSIFSCFGPIGCYLGMILNEFATPLVDAFMLATVAGTFIYVGATEVIPEEWEDGENKWKKFGILLTGIVTIFGITQYTNNLEEAIMFP